MKGFALDLVAFVAYTPQKLIPFFECGNPFGDQKDKRGQVRNLFSNFN